MKKSQLLVAGIALVAGAGAFFLMMGDDPVEAPVQIVQPVKEETVRVLISTRDIQRGERLAIEDTTWIAWPKKGIQPSFITDATPDARENLSAAVARSLIVMGEPVVNQKIVKAGNSGLMAAILSPGMRAVTLRVSPETASGGFILPGDRVDLLHTTGATTRMTFEEVRVLAVNTVYSENTESANIAGSNITLEMTPDDAQTFLSRRTNGTFSVVLRSIFKPEGEVTTSRNNSDVTIIRYGRS